MSLRALAGFFVAQFLAAAPAVAQVMQPSTTAPTQQELDAADTDPANWLLFNKGYLGYRYSSLSAINTATAAQVKVLCTADLGFHGGFESGPVVYNGVLYVTAGLTTYAIDAATCATVWTYTYAGLKKSSAPNRGLALSEGRVIRETIDGHLIALDARTGALLWNQQVMDSGIGEIGVGAPVAWNGLVFVGKAGGDKGIQGEVMAFHVADGSFAWGFNTIPNPGETGSDTWPTPFSIQHGGGATWSTFTIDEARGLLLFPVGNPGPAENKSVRKGANLFTSSIVALDAMTGALSWWHQLLPGDDRDWDTTTAAALTTAKGLDVALAAGKDGVLHVVDRADGSLRYKVPLVVNYLNTKTRVPMGTGIRICPITAVQWNGPSYSPSANTIYVNGIDWCTQAIQGPAPVYMVDKGYAGWANTEGGKRDPVSNAFGVVNAIDADTGALLWRVKTGAPLLGGIVATGGGVVVTGGIDGTVLFLDAGTGSQLASVAVGQPIGGGIVSYAVAGVQRLAVAAGITSGDYATSGVATIAVLGVP